MKKILIVDDSAFFRSLLKDELTKESERMRDHDLHIVEAHNGYSAMQQIEKESPDLVFLDVVMQESENEGVKILSKIRDLYPDLKVVMLTSVGQLSVIKKCQDLGIDDYIQKPFESSEINATLKKHLI